jgi:hypothetical protein
VNEPLPSSEVRRLAKALVVGGTVIYSDHALIEMGKDKLTKPEVERVLRAGSAGDGEWENGSWRYQMGTPGIVVVIAFRSATALVIVTAWRKRR